MIKIIGKIFALVAAFFFSCQAILARRALSEGGDVILGTLINTLAGVVFLWPFTFFFDHNPTNLNPTNKTDAIILFIVSGALIQAQRIPIFLAFKMVGVSVAQPILNSSSLFAATAAMFLLGEEITAQLVMAALMIIFSVYLLGAGGKQANVKQKVFKLKKGILISLFVAACTGVGHVVRKMGLNKLNMPIFGAAIGSTVGVIFAAIIMGVVSASSREHVKVSSLKKKSFLFFLSSGFVVAIAVICAFCAFSFVTSEVATVSSLLSTTPFYTLLLTFVFLRGVERLNIRIVLGCVVIVLSTVLLLS